MLITRYISGDARRRGVILIVVLAMLVLFTIVGLSFVLVANAQETSARIARESENMMRPQIDPETAFAYFMGQLIYDTSDTDSVGVYSALRGHSLARNMYGWNDQGLNDKPYNGTGRLHNTMTSPLATATNPIARDDAFLMNYQYFPLDGFLRDPEYNSARATNNIQPGAAGRGTYTGGFNVPYTYPDHNNFYLAAIDPSTGQIIAPSFHREYLFGRLDLPPGAAPTGNPNWANVEGKYLTLRPRQLEHTAAFPMPVDRFGDVKNLDGAPGGCDSIWIDMGAPVMTMADGRKYKMLVAPLILQLDGRINLNAVGNLMGYAKTNPQTHRSNQGWWTWEVNPSYVLNEPTALTEWRRVFLGSDEAVSGTARVRGRYDNGSGGVRKPLPTPLSGSLMMRLWAQGDFNGMRDAANAGDPANPVTLPTAGSAAAWYAFPNFPADTYLNGVGETTDHPQYYDTLNPPANNNRHLPLSGMAQLLRFGGTGSEMLTSDLMRLLPKNLVSGSNTVRRRNQLTLRSMDIDRPGAVPYVWNPADAVAAPTTRYGMGLPPIVSPTGNQPIPFPSLATRGTAPPAGSEFDAATWRSVLAALGRVNLTRSLLSYPAVDGSGQSTDAVASRAAAKDRAAFAQGIFDVLRYSVGAGTPANVLATYTANSNEYRALRYLAQLAVNIVDYIDNDDYSTPFNWHPGTKEYVFGVELPRLVINESYVQYDNVPADVTAKAVTAASFYNVNVWVELMNPVPKDTVYIGGGEDCNARLYTDNGTTKYAVYRILLGDETAPAEIRKPDNPLGDPGATSATATRQTQGRPGFTDWGTTAVTQNVLPFAPTNRFSGAAAGNVGLYVIGPDKAGYDVATAEPNLNPTYTSTQMTYQIKVVDAPVGTGVPRPTIVLQRLANPTLPPNIAPVNPEDYNPYVTTDFVERAAAQVNDGRGYEYDNVNKATKVLIPAAMNRRQAWGRMQPYDGANDNNGRLKAQPAGAANQPMNTFFRQNSTESDPTKLAAVAANGDATLKVPFDWLVHLDRYLINPIELYHVSGAKPAELTQRFVTGAVGTTTANAHRAPWQDQTARIYRFLEFASAGPRGQGLALGGRQPGKVNINAVWTREVFRALCDAQAGNSFSAAEVDAVADAFITQRSPGTTSMNPTVVGGKPVLGPTDQGLATLTGLPLNRPFWPLSMGYNAAADASYGGPRGIENTIFRTNATKTGMVFDVGLSPPNAAPRHPYQQKELLTKIFNNVTTRSNVFAVWLTVGFFEVTDDTTRPVKLGAEIGKAENRHIRHRMFAIIDRTQLTAFSASLSGAVTGNQTITNILKLPIPDGRTGRTVSAIPDGTILTFSPNSANEENVVVQGGQVNLTRTHSTVTCRGNPGPWVRYDPRYDTDVVPHFAIID